MRGLQLLVTGKSEATDLKSLGCCQQERVLQMSLPLHSQHRHVSPLQTFSRSTLSACMLPSEEMLINFLLRESFPAGSWLPHSTTLRALAKPWLLEQPRRFRSMGSNELISALPLQNEGARREMASSSGDKSSTADSVFLSEVVVVSEPPNSSASEASEHLSKQQPLESPYAKVHCAPINFFFKP